MHGSVRCNLAQTITVSSTPVAINLPHSWRIRINTKAADTTFPVEPFKQCERRTNVHCHSVILHKIPIQNQQGFSLENNTVLYSAGSFLRPLTPNEDCCASFLVQQEVICTDYMFWNPCLLRTKKWVKVTLEDCIRLCAFHARQHVWFNESCARSWHTCCDIDLETVFACLIFMIE